MFFNNTAGGTPEDQNGYDTANFIVATSDPLGPLGDNGGPTQTMVPVSGGAAICAGVVVLLPGGSMRDPRGFPRVAPPNCLDAGSVQHEVIPVPVLSPPVLALLASLLVMFGIYRLRYAAG